MSALLENKKAVLQYYHSLKKQKLGTVTEKYADVGIFALFPT